MEDLHTSLGLHVPKVMLDIVGQKLGNGDDLPYISTRRQGYSFGNASSG